MEEQYDYFDEQKERKAMIEGAKKIVKYAVRNNVQGVILAGRSAKYAGLLFKEIWKQLYPNKPMPKFYAIGDLGKVFAEESQTEKKEIIKAVQEKAPKFFELKNKPVMLLEESIANGYQISNLYHNLKSLGFQKMFPAAVFYDPPILSRYSPSQILKSLIRGENIRKGFFKRAKKSKLRIFVGKSMPIAFSAKLNPLFKTREELEFSRHYSKANCCKARRKTSLENQRQIRREIRRIAQQIKPRRRI